MNVYPGKVGILMSQSLAKILVHIVFSTENRLDYFKEPEIRRALYQYLGGICREKKCPSIIIGGTENHVHILCLLGRTTDVSTLVRDLKRCSSVWVKERIPTLKLFSWQRGYGVFSIGQSQVEILKRYVENQESHHKKMDFQEELRELLIKYQVEFDEKYLWD